MGTVQVSAGPIEYIDTGGDGRVLVLLHGLAMDGRLWGQVMSELGEGWRCVMPTLPFGAHRVPMRADADLSLRGIGRIVAELLERLDLRDVTLCFNDWGGAQVMISQGLMDRVGRLALVACEAFENYPPGLPGRLAAVSARMPGGIAMMRRALLVRKLRELPITFGRMSKHGVPDELMRDPACPAGSRRCRRGCPFERPVLVVWASEDRMMRPAFGARLVAAFPDARLVEVADSYTLVPIDQPKLLAAALCEFAVD